MVLFFTNGVANTASLAPSQGSLVAHDAQTATLHVTDASTAIPPGADRR